LGSGDPRLWFAASTFARRLTDAARHRFSDRPRWQPEFAPAERFTGISARHTSEAFYVSRITWAEFAEGAATIDDTREALTGFACLEISEDTAWIASRIARQLKHAGLHIGDNDVWQAAIAMEHQLPLVTGNLQHFTRVTGLRVVTHREIS
jgi:predicted nucleic acid-binding protein